MNHITESETNKLFRFCMLIFVHIILVIGILFLSFQLLMIYILPFSYIQLYPIVLSTAFIIPSVYLRNRIARITMFGDNSLSLLSSRYELHLDVHQIVHISKIVRFTLSERALYMILFYNKKEKMERWIFQGEKNVDLLQKFKSMGIRLKNIP